MRTNFPLLIILYVTLTTTSLLALEPIPKCPSSITTDSHKNFTPVLELLTSDTSDIIIFSLASGGMENQIIPSFIINTALKYPSLKFYIIAIDPEHTFENLQKLFNESSKYRLTNKRDKNYTIITVFHESKQITNLSVVAFSLFFPATKYKDKEDEYEKYINTTYKWLELFFEQKLNEKKIIFWGNHAALGFHIPNTTPFWRIIRALKGKYSDLFLIYNQFLDFPWLVLNPPNISSLKTYMLAPDDYFSDKTNTTDRQVPFSDILDIELNTSTKKIIQINGTFLKNFPQFIKGKIPDRLCKTMCPPQIILRDALVLLKEKLLILANTLIT
jgi:hypothetical protein